MADKPTYEELEQRVKELEQEHGKRKQAEDALKDSEEKFKLIAETSPDYIYQVDREGTITYCSPAVKLILEYTPEELIGTNFINLVPPSSISETLEKFQLIVSEKGMGIFELQLLNKSGTVVDVETNAATLIKDGKIVGVQGITRDIAEHKQAEEMLLESENRFKMLAESTFEGILIHEGAKVFDVNKNFQNMFGYERSELIGMDALELVAPESKELVRNNIRSETTQPYEAVGLRKDISTFIMEINAGMVNYKDKRLRVAVCRDITDRKQVEEALRESEVKYRHLVEHAPTGIYNIDLLRDKFTSVNDAMIIFSGYSKEELLSMKVSSLLTDASKQLFFDRVKRASEGEQVPETVELEMIIKDGTTHWASLSTNYKYENNKLIGASVIAHDITERKQAEDALRESEERFRDLAEMLPEAVFETNRNIELTYANRHAYEMFGYSAEDLKRGLNGLELIDPKDHEHAMANIAMRLKGGDPGTIEYQALRKDGSSFPMLFHASSIIKEGELFGLRGIVVDITERKQAEEALLKSRTELRHLSSQLIRAQEEERKRISLELHDEMGSSLTEIGLYLTEIEENLPEDLDPGIRNRFADMHSIVSEASEKISELSLNLRPSMLDHLGLIPTLRWHFEQLGKRTSLEINFETFDIGERLDLDIETVLYRVSQEALNNIIKHADATNVTVRLEQKPEAIVLTIKDDGKSFDIDEILTNHPSERLGIIGMQERVSMVKGNLSIQSSKGEGTQILIETPLH